MTPRPWRGLGRRTLLRQPPWLTVGEESWALPDGRIVEQFQWLATHDWAMAAAITETGAVLVERCFKPGIGRVALLLPAGAIDAGEAPEAAMRRELLEETGYASDDWTALGSFRLDPNYGVSTGHLFLARGARKVAEPDGRDLEEIEVVELTLGEALSAARAGELASMGSAACLALAALALTPTRFADDGAARGAR